MKGKYDWPRGPTWWIFQKTLYYSIPFTWNLPEVKLTLMQQPLFHIYNRVVVGGPAIYLMPDYFRGMDYVSIGHHSDGVIQRINPMATKTTTGCIRRCEFCAVPGIEGKLVELSDWPDLPILMDNNLLAASLPHFDKVIDRLVKWGWADFNQGLDSRLLTEYHAGRLSEIKKPIIRLALDSMQYEKSWVTAFNILRDAGIALRNIRSYALIGFDSDPKEAWERCKFISSFGIKALPQWFHELDAMENNSVTEKQKLLGWTDSDRKNIMQRYYQRGKKRGYHPVIDIEDRLFN